MSKVIFTTEISDEDLKSIALQHGYKSEINSEGKIYVNPETEIEFALNHLRGYLSAVLENEITCPKMENYSPKDFNNLKVATLENLNQVSTISIQ